MSLSWGQTSLNHWNQRHLDDRLSEKDLIWLYCQKTITKTKSGSKNQGLMCQCEINWIRMWTGSLSVERSCRSESICFLSLQLLEYNDINDTAEPTSDLFPPYELQNFIWSRLNLSGPTALLCGANATFINGSLCFQVRPVTMETAGSFN